jgi:hypothetical protein
MRILLGTALAAALLSGSASAASVTVSKFYDLQLSALESEMVPLAEAMPADRYGFAPKDGAFQGVRTFADQVKHLAAVMYMVSAATIGEALPVDTGGESGPAAVKSKEQIVQFLKAAFAYAHKAMAALNEKNQLELAKSPFGGPDMPRGAIASVAVWHSFDHYGQMVVYARMNGVIPPASRPTPPPAPAKK